MKVHLSNRTENLIGARLRAGRFQTADDVVLAGLAALDQQEQFGDFADGELNELLAEGERGIARSGTIDAREVFAQIRRGTTGRIPTLREKKS